MEKEIKTFAPSSSPSKVTFSKSLQIPARDKPSQVIVAGAGVFGGWNSDWELK